MTTTRNITESQCYFDFCKNKLNELTKLKDGTKKLLVVLETMQSKILAKTEFKDDLPDLTKALSAEAQNEGRKDASSATVNFESMSDVVNSIAINQLAEQTKRLDSIDIEDEADDCSVYKRLTRKCVCLNRKEFNDFIIQFNDDNKYSTSKLGEMIKNMRILKKFLYMGGSYTNNSLVFLNEGLTKCVHAEKVEIALACSHADICNVFDGDSLVKVCLTLPFKYSTSGDTLTQSLAASFLFNLVRIEEGRRYLNFNSKIANYIKGLLKTRGKKLDNSTTEYLQTTLSLMNPPPDANISVTYYCKAEEGAANRILNGLVHFRHFMTTEEVLAQLDVLSKICQNETGKKEVTQFLQQLLNVFKHLLLEHDTNEINMLVTQILTQITKKNTEHKSLNKTQEPLIVADIWTESIGSGDTRFRIGALERYHPSSTQAVSQ